MKMKLIFSNKAYIVLGILLIVSIGYIFNDYFKDVEKAKKRSGLQVSLDKEKRYTDSLTTIIHNDSIVKVGLNRMNDSLLIIEQEQKQGIIKLKQKYNNLYEAIKNNTSDDNYNAILDFLPE